MVMIVGLAVRIFLAPFTAHPFDVWAWYQFGQSALSGQLPISSFMIPYQYSFFFFVFPASVGARLLSRVLGNYTIPVSSIDPRLDPGIHSPIPVIPGLLFDFLVKLPLIFRMHCSVIFSTSSQGSVWNQRLLPLYS
jgi:hypothetical protein